MNSGKREEQRLLRRVVGQFRPYRGKVGLVAVLILVTAGLGVANPLLVKVVFDPGAVRAVFHRYPHGRSPVPVSP